MRKLLAKIANRILGSRKQSSSSQAAPPPAHQHSRAHAHSEPQVSADGKSHSGEDQERGHGQQHRRDDRSPRGGRSRGGRGGGRRGTGHGDNRGPRRDGPPGASGSQGPHRRHEGNRPPVHRGPVTVDRPHAETESDHAVAAEHHSRWSLDQFQVPPEEGKSRFHDYNLPSPIMHAIHDLGFKYCTPIQAKVLGLTVKGQNIAGRAQTGTGKTAAFLIGIFRQFVEDAKQGVERIPGAPRALVLAPTRELVVQIARDAQALGKYCRSRCVAVYGGMDFDKQRRELLHGAVDIVAATPGRLLDFVSRRVLDLSHVEVLVIDEADRMLDMGFIPDVRRIIRSTPPKERRRTMLFSATLTEDVLRLAAQWMPDPAICECEPEQVAVDTVKQVVYVVAARDKLKLLCNMLKDPAFKKVLVFGNRRDSTRRLVDALGRHGFHCGYLSGDVDQEKRMKVLEAFKAGRHSIVVATDVAGRGIHVDGISHVINFDFPYEAEDYVHRIGRTGRAGVEGTAISFACEDESFVIPAIEKYIGRELACSVPDEALFAPLSHETR